MICQFTGGIVDGALVEAPIEDYWVDGSPPVLLWVLVNGVGELGMQTAVGPQHGGERYYMTRVERSDELQNLVYHYRHHRLQIPNESRTEENSSI